MRFRHLATGSLIVMATLVLWQVNQATIRAGALAATKKVRISNATDADIRVWCVRFAKTGDNHFIADVKEGASPVTVQGVDTGDRGVVVYEMLNETVIVTGQF